MKKLLFLILVLPLFVLGQTTQPVTMQFRSFGQRYPIYTWSGIPGGGYDTLFNSQRLRDLFKLKADSVNNDGYVTHGYLNANRPIYNFFNGIKDYGGANIGLGGLLTNGVDIEANGNRFQIHDFFNNPGFGILGFNDEASMSSFGGDFRNSLLQVNQFSARLSHGDLDQSINEGMVFSIDSVSGGKYTDDQMHRGIVYSKVNRSLFVDTSLVDKGYVDSLGIGSNEYSDSLYARTVNKFDDQIGIAGNKTFTDSVKANGFLTTASGTDPLLRIFTNNISSSSGNAIRFERSILSYFSIQHEFKDLSGNVYLTLGNGSDGPLSEATHLRVTNAPVNSKDLLRLQDIGGVIPTGGFATNTHVDSVRSSTTQNQILLYDKSFYTSLTDFVKYGTFTPSLTTDFGILMTGGVSGTDTTNYIRLKGFTNNDDLLNVEVTYVVNDLTGYGIGIGRKTISTTSDYSAFASYDLVNNNVVSRGFTATRTNPSNITVAVNDVCKLIFRIRGNLLITDFYDITQNKYATVSGVNNILNTGDIAIYEHGGSVTIKGIKAYSSSPRNPDLVFLSDSKLRNPVNGAAIGNWDHSFGITATFSGQGDKLTHLLRALPYVLTYIKPKQVIVNITRNDLNAGVMPDSVKTQYATLIHKLDSAGIVSAYFKAIPETVIPDQSALNHLVDSLASGRTIDVSPYWSNAIDLGSDGIHPNLDGARLLAWVTKRSGYFDTTSVHSQPPTLTEQNYAKYNQNNNFNINQVVNGVVVGTRTTFPSDANSHIYTTGVNAPVGYPFANSNQLVLESSANTNKAIVFRTNGANRAYIDASGNFTVGKTDGTVAVTGAKMSVSGAFGATGTVTLGTYSSTGGLLYTSSAAGLMAQLASTSTGNVLHAGGASTAPLWGKVTSSDIDATVAPTNSPVLVTPNLGTPSAAVLTNAIGLPTAGLVNNAVTYAKMQTMTTNKLLGSGSGTAVAEITLGTNLSFSGTTLNVSSSTDNILSKTADYTIVAGDFVAGKKTTLDLYIDATAGNVTITMPSATTFAGYTIYVTKTDASINTVTINTVLGSNTLITQYQERQFNSNSTSWFNH